MEIKRNQIILHHSHVKELAKEFNTSNVTIWNALRDVTQSKLAKSIRTRGKEILEKEAKSIKV